MLEERNEYLRGVVASLTKDKILLEDRVKLLNGVLATYAKMPSLIIATERITDALAQTITRISSKF
jgi:hypothetical protein